MKLDARKVLDRSKKAFGKKELWRTIYEDCYRYALPQRNLYEGYYEGNVPGQNKMNMVFDSTAIHSTQRFANRIQSGLFPPVKKWCRLEPGNEIPDQFKTETQKALDLYSDKMFSILRQSNFDLAMGEFLLDLSVGTAAMLVQPGDDTIPLRFTPVPQYVLALEEGPYGTVDNVYRKYKIRAEAITRTFPDAKIPNVLKRLIEDKPQEMVELLEAVIADVERGDFCYHIIYGKSADELVFRRMKQSPWIIARYMKLPGEVFGRGPLVSALPDIKTLNKTLELLLKNASIACAGVYTAADDGVINPSNIRIAPGSIIPVARNGGPQGASLAPLPRSGDFNVSQIVINDLDNMSARSATEIVERMKELAQNMGAAFGRLITETMVPIVSKTLHIMDEKGLIQMPLKVNGLQVRVVPVSPLAKAQNLEEVNEVMQFVQIANSLGPGGVAEVKPDEIASFVADKFGVPANLRNTPEEKEAIMQQAMQSASVTAGMIQEAEQGQQDAVQAEEPATALVEEASA